MLHSIDLRQSCNNISEYHEVFFIVGSEQIFATVSLSDTDSGGVGLNDFK